MGNAVVLVSAALSFLPTALGLDPRAALIPPRSDAPCINWPAEQPNSCARKAFGYLTCHGPAVPACIAQIGVQAASFCTKFLSLEATAFNTVTDIATATSTATVTLTSDATIISITTSTTATTTTDIFTTTTTSPTSTFTAPTSYVPPPATSIAPLNRRGHDNRIPIFSPDCPVIHYAHLSRRPPHKLSSICSCLGFTSTSTLTSTATTSTTTTVPTTTTTVTTSTTITVLISLATSTTTTSTTTTTTSRTVATETPVADYCDITYDGGGVTPGNTVIRPPGDYTGRECCVLCWNTQNCVASAVGLGYCQLLVKTSLLEGSPTTAQCPLGVENYTYLEGPGTLYRGPCSPRLN